MKRVLTGLCLLALSGCAASPKTAPLTVHLEPQYGTVKVSWDRPEGNDLHYDILLSTVSGSDGGKTGMMVYHTETDREVFQGITPIAWYAQEHDYYGPMRFQITAYEGSKAIAQGISEPFAVSEFFPAETEIAMVPFEEVESFSYTGSGDSSFLIFNYELYREAEGVRLIGKFEDEEGSHEADASVPIDAFEKLRPFVEAGRLVRRRAEEPDLEILDGSDSRMDIRWKNETEIQKSWYEFQPNGEDREALIDYLKELVIQEEQKS